jgi:hypothetical protein
MKRSLRTLLESAVDYAGTFPPARLGLDAAVRSYAGYRAGPHAWMLGRFIVPAPMLDDLGALLPEADASAGGAWPLSVILPPVPSGEMGRLEAFARRNEGRARIDSVEEPPREPSMILEAASRMPRGIETFFEVAPLTDLEGHLEAIAAAGAAAKVRTGGLREDAFPGARDLALFMAACRRTGLAFKATSGLHHPIRGSHPVDSGPASPQAVMHGYLNLAVAACLVHAGKAGPEEAIEILEERSVEAFRLLDDGIEWRGRRLDLAGIANARRSFFRSFGACSFEEPVEGLEQSGLL